MVANARNLQTQQRRHLALGPAQPMDQHHHDPLTLRQRCERVVKTRLHTGKLTRRPRREHDLAAPTPRVIATNPIDVPGPVAHPSDPLPVLPRIRQPFRKGLRGGVDTHRGDQRATKPRLVFLHEGRELGRCPILHDPPRRQTPIKVPSSPKVSQRMDTAASRSTHPRRDVLPKPPALDPMKGEPFRRMSPGWVGSRDACGRGTVKPRAQVGEVRTVAAVSGARPVPDCWLLRKASVSASGQGETHGKTNDRDAAQDRQAPGSTN